MCGGCMVIYLQFMVLEVCRIMESAPSLCWQMVVHNVERSNYLECIKADNSIFILCVMLPCVVVWHSIISHSWY
jgi:hypothetical protein